MNRCTCPVCAVRDALRQLEGAHEAWVEQAGETEMQFAYLRVEVSAVLCSPLSLLVRRRLRRALEVCS